jgi:hypothetical protein
MQAEQAPATKAAAVRVRVKKEPSAVLGKRTSERLLINPPKPFIFDDVFDDEVCMGFARTHVPSNTHTVAHRARMRRTRIQLVTISASRRSR